MAVPIAMLVGFLEGAGAFTLSGGLEVLIPTLLVIMGLGIGFLNIQHGETVKFMLAAILISVVGFGSLTLSMLQLVTGIIGGILMYLGMVVAPAGIVVALKVLWSTSK